MRGNTRAQPSAAVVAGTLDASAPRSAAGSRSAIARLVGRRASLQGALWGAVFGLYTFSSAVGFARSYPTQVSRAAVAASLGQNTGLAALLGRPHDIDTIAGFTAWRGLGVLALMGAVWGLLAGTRLLRGEEEAGRWELPLAGQTTRRHAALQAIAGLAAGWVSLWSLTTVLVIAVGHQTSLAVPASAALFYSTVAAASAATFLAVGAVASQLAATRRKASMIASSAFGVALAIRVIAASDTRLSWLSWLSPLGWVEQAHALTGSRPIVLLPMALLVVVLLATAWWLAGVRDVGAGALANHDSARPRTRTLGGPIGLACRVLRPVAIGWTAALAGLGLLFGLVAESAGRAESESPALQRTLSRISAHGAGAAAYLGITFLVVTTMVLLVAAGQVVATRDEEDTGRLDQLLARPVSRVGWLAGRLGVTAAFLLLCGVVAGLAAWLGAASQHSGLDPGRLLLAGVNTVPAAVFLLGVGTLVHATAPRWTAPLVYAVVAWSFLIEFVAALLGGASWLLDTSLLYHVAAAPAKNPNWTSAAALAGLGALAALVGALVFHRRDLKSA